MINIFKNHKLLLVVDDDSDYISDLEDSLSQTGLVCKLHHVKQFPDISSIDTSDYDVVFLDLVMSGVSENKVFEFCKYISQRAPVIIVSPNEDKRLIEKSINSGSHAFLAKDSLNIYCITHAISKAIERYYVDKREYSDKLLEFKKIIKNLETKLKVGYRAECRNCSHAKCRLNEAIHRLKLMA